ncbi:MAG: DUF2877 domain-containing protein [Clostridia bacterium]
MEAAILMCERLLAMASDPSTGHVHTVFDQAVNIDLKDRLVSIVMEPKHLTPYGCTVRADIPFPARGIAEGQTVVLRADGMSIENHLNVSWCDAEVHILSVDSITLSNEPIHLRDRLQPVISVLRAGSEVDGLSALATGSEGNIYTDFLQPRFEKLFDAVAVENQNRALTAVSRVAGCGVGLTPSSDDFLCGYFLTLRLLSNLYRMRDVCKFLPQMAEVAAKKTNRISGTFLIDSGEGFANQAVLSFLKVLCSGADELAVRGAAERVASIGSTSGRDILTGICLAIYQHDGGKNSGQTGNSEKFIL